jgi:hypothetical protein
MSPGTDTPVYSKNTPEDIFKYEDIQAAACKYLDKNIFLIAMPEKPDM